MNVEGVSCLTKSSSVGFSFEGVAAFDWAPVDLKL